MLIVCIKFFSVVLFLKYGVYCKIDYKNILKIKLGFKEINKLIVENISFAVIGGISVLFWSFGNIIITKFLTINDITNYDIIFKIFGMAQILPVIFSTTVFPKLVKVANTDLSDLRREAEKYYYLYLIYGVTSYVFVYSYADIFIPLLFGSKYILAISYCKEMFLTMIIFPIVLLQANILIALKKEKIDMWMNLIVLIMNILFCLLGVIFIKNLSIINYSIFASFIIFMIMQDTYLVKLKIHEVHRITKKYIAIISFGVSLGITVLYVNEIWIFPIYLMVIGIILLSLQVKNMGNDVLVMAPNKLTK
jgi:O-antigen/teichoic acid export membrane protein